MTACAASSRRPGPRSPRGGADAGPRALRHPTATGRCAHAPHAGARAPGAGARPAAAGALWRPPGPRPRDRAAAALAVGAAAEGDRPAHPGGPGVRHRHGAELAEQRNLRRAARWSPRLPQPQLPGALMAKEQKRRVISFTRELYNALQDLARREGDSISNLAETFLRRMTGLPVRGAEVAPSPPRQSRIVALRPTRPAASPAPPPPADIVDPSDQYDVEGAKPRRQTQSP